MAWILLTYKLPSNPSRARVAVWREIRRSGALHLQQSVVAFPKTPAFRDAVERFRSLVTEVGGESLVLQGEPLGAADGLQLADGWNGARNAEYTELIAVSERFLAEIDHEFEIQKFTSAELEEEEAELEKLQRWYERIRARDVLNASEAPSAEDALKRAVDALSRYSAAVYERTPP